MQVLWLFVVFVVLLLIAVPVSITLGITSVLPSIMDPSFTVGAKYLIRAMFGGLDSFPLLAVPMFVLSGIIMAKGGISKRLFDVFAYFLGKLPAGMPAAVIVTCLFYGAISGSGPATVAAVGSMTIPILVGLGYAKDFATAIVAVAGGLGVIIPPSIPFIMYGMASGASVSDLFLAGIIPGLLIALLLIGYAVYHCARYGEDKQKIFAEVDALHKKGLLTVLKESFFALLLPVIILGCIYTGVASPTEAAVISVFYALIVSMFIYRTLKPKEIWTIIVESLRTYTPILFILATSTAFSRVLTLMHVPQMVSEAIINNFHSPVAILLIINLFLLIMGMVMDTTPAILILTPILLPIATAIGMSPIQFGVIMVVNLAIGFVTPPIGVNLFVASSLTNVPIMQISKKAMPMIALFLAALLLITFIPAISLALLQEETMKRKSVFALFLCLFFGCSSLISGCSSSEQTFAWPLATASAEDTVTQLFAVKFAEEVSRLSGGQMKIEVYPNSTLGGDRDLLESCADGDIPFIVQNTAPQVTFMPDLAVFDLPCAYSSLEELRAAVDNPQLYEPISAVYTEAGYHLLGIADQGFRVMSTNKEVEELADFKGQKIRTMENPCHLSFWSSLGAAPTPMSFSEVYIGLQQHTIDAQENPYEVIVSNRLYEQQDYVVETNHLPHLITLIVNDEFYQNFDEEQKAILDEAAAIATEYARQMSDERISLKISEIEESGTQIIQLDESVHEQMREASSGLYETIKSKVDSDIYNAYASGS